MKNKLIDLNNHLFTALERLNDEDIAKDKELLTNEIERSKAITNVAKAIVENASLVLAAQKLKAENKNFESPIMIDSKQ